MDEAAGHTRHSGSSGTTRWREVADIGGLKQALGQGIRHRIGRTRLGTEARSTPLSQFRKINDLRPIDDDFAARTYGGDYHFSGHTPVLADRCVFGINDAPESWQAELHGFRWLRHFCSSKVDIHHNHAATCLLDWATLHARTSDTIVWRGDVVAARLIAWHQHAPELLHRHSAGRERIIVKSFQRQARHLERHIHQLPAGHARLHSAIALTCSALCLRRGEAALKKASRRLDQFLEQQFGGDGMHMSRNPGTLVELLADLVPLREAFQEAGIPASDTLIHTVDRALSCLSLLRHADGSLAQFNGTGPSPEKLLGRLDPHFPAPGGTRSGVQKSAPQGGYERMEGGGTIVLMDTGAPPPGPSDHILAGTLSFEMSSGGHPYIINCGLPAQHRPPHAAYFRASAAHSTAIVADTSSTRERDGLLRQAENWLPGRDGVNKTSCLRTNREGWSEIDASHDGYLRPFGLIHRRLLQMNDGGDVINGADSFDPPARTGNGTMQNTPLAIRFHLHPAVGASMLSNGRSILLAGPGGEAWTLTCIDAPLRLEESIWFAAPGGPRKSEQIVISARIADSCEIRWVLQKKSGKRPSDKFPKPKARTGDLLDLLDETHDGGTRN